MTKRIQRRTGVTLGRRLSIGLLVVLAVFSFAGGEVTWSHDFEAGALGPVEAIDATTYRIWIPGQQDQHGRNHQATWFYCRLDGVAGKKLTLILAGFPGEYDGRPDRRVKTHYRPVYSEDGQTWQHLEEGTWNEEAIELSLRLQPRADTVWLAYLHPYPWSRIERLVTEVAGSPWGKTDVLGQSVEGRPLHRIAVTNPGVPAKNKRHLWLVARQHAWETGTSYVLEGALRFALSDDPLAARLRDEAIVQFVPTMDPDGCAQGRVRFNALGYDLNRNWEAVIAADASARANMPEIWAVKRTLAEQQREAPIDLLVNLHNNDMNEYMVTRVSDGPQREMIEGLFRRLRDHTVFEPSREKLTVLDNPVPGRSTTNSLWSEMALPTVLIEQRIGPSPGLGRRPNIEERLRFGRELLEQMVAAVRWTERP